LVLVQPNRRDWGGDEYSEMRIMTSYAEERDEELEDEEDNGPDPLCNYPHGDRLLAKNNEITRNGANTVEQQSDFECIRCS
jgi:hypothetical protein